jgi:hypothetical protein
MTAAKYLGAPVSTRLGRGVISRSLRFVSRYGLQFLPAYASDFALSR